MRRQNSYRRQDDGQDAVLLGWVLILGIVGILYFLAYDRLHVRASQLVEMTIYPLLLGVFLWEILRYKATKKNEMEAAWPRPIPCVSQKKEEAYLRLARKQNSVLLGYDIFGEPFYWSDGTRTMQSNAFGMTGAGKTNLLETVTEQDILRGVPIIFIDGKGDKKLLAELLPSIEAAGRMQDLRVIDPMRPEISARYNPFWAPEGNAEEHVGFVFESFNMEKDFFEGHQRVYLENIARVLHYSGKRFNFHDVLVCAYDQALLKAQMKVALDRVALDAAITRQQKLTLTMSVRNLLESFDDKERVSKIQGLINEMMTFMGDDMAMITGPYDELLSLDDVIDKGLILFMSLNVNVNERAVTALGRMLLQNLQLMIGRRYSRAEEGEQQPFVSVIMDEFSPFAYENFAHILQTARGANVAFLFALQSAPQLLQVGRGFRNDVASAPNTTFMLRTKDEETAQYFLKASARVRQMRRSMHVQKKGVFNPEFEEGTEGSQTEIKDTLAQDEHIKKMPVGQMEILMTDPFRGTVHKHLHIKKAFSHWFPQVPMNVYPKLDTVEADSHGLNLGFPVPDLEEKEAAEAEKMKRYGIAMVMLLLSLGVASGQEAQPRTAQSTEVAQTLTSSISSSYDPMARGNANSGQPKGIVETTLAGVNPQNKDYGAVIADWRKEVFEATINRIYLWSIFILCLLLGVSLLGNGWLFRERQRRLAISANIIVQLYNAYVGSRARALEVIVKHNTLVERYNRLSAEKDALLSQLTGGNRELSASETDFETAKRDKGIRQNARVEETSLQIHEDGGEGENRTDSDLLRGQLKDLETKLQRRDAQLQAKENAITNLRTRLARAHDSLEGQRLQKSGMK